MDEAQLQILLNRAANMGAKEALKEIGLEDREAGRDIHDLRQLLDDFRSAKRTVTKSILKSVSVALIGFIAAAVWMTYGQPP